MNVRPFVIMILSLIPLAALGSERKYDLLMTGVWQGDEVSAKSGEQWLALIEDERGTTLRPVTIKIERVHDGIVDEPGAKTGKRISCDCDGESTILLRGRVGRGAIDEAKTNELLEATMSSGAKLALSLPRDTIYVETRLAQQREDEPPLYDVVVRGGGVEQLLVRSESNMVQPIWSGDLDDDGRVDLIFDTSDHYNVFAPTLFLSSEAKEGEVVGAAVTFTTSGC